MTINYTTLLGLAKPVTGTETGQWGDVVNDQITSLLEDAVANASTISVTAGNVTLSTTTGASNQARMSTLILTGTPGTTRNVVAPSQSKMYVVINQSDGAVVIKGSATTGVTVGAGQTAQVAWNGSDFVEIGNYVHGNFVVNGNLSVNGNSTLGDGGADTTTLNGQFIAANSNISKSTTLTTSVPALTWIKGATYTDTGTAGGTTQAHAPFNLISAPTLSTSNIVTYTNASTLYIAGAPSAGGSATITNPYSMYVAAGAAYLGGALTAASTVTLSGGTANGVLYLNGSKVATSGSALTFDGTNLGINCTATPYAAGDRLLQINGGASPSEIRLTNNTASTTGALFQQAGNDLYIWNVANSFISFGVNATEQMRLTSTGLGIGTSSPGAKLDVVGTIKATAAQGLLLNNSAGVYATIQYNGTSIGDIGTGNQVYSGGTTTDLGISARAGYRLVLGSNGVAQATLDSSGNLGLGVTPSAWRTDRKALQVNYASLYAGNTANYAVLGNNIYIDSAGAVRYISNAVGSSYVQDTSGAHSWNIFTGNTGAGNAPTTSNQAMTLNQNSTLSLVSPVNTTQAQITLSDTDGRTLALRSPNSGSPNIAQIGTTTNHDVALLTSNTERARITSGGDLLVGATSGVGKLYVESSGVQAVLRNTSASSYTSLRLYNDQNSNIRALEIDYFGSTASGGERAEITTTGAYPLCFLTSNAERARITSGGVLLVGKTAADTTVAGCELYPTAGAIFTRSSGDALLVNRETSDGDAVTLRRSNVTVGTISVTTTATAYNTSSDYRLKDNPQPLTGSGAFIDALQPKTWDWKTDGSRGVGFIAHEAQAVSPSSVVGEKDAVDADGKPVMQAMEYGSAEFIANIIAELQSLRARVAALEKP